MLNFPVNQEKHVYKVLKKLVDFNSMTGKNRKLIKPVRKASLENFLHFTANLSALNTPTYKLAKFAAPVLKSLTTNEFTLKNFVHFAEEVVHLQSYFFMSSLDVD